MFRETTQPGAASAVEAARKAREERAAAKESAATHAQQTAAAAVIQRNVRPLLARKRLRQLRRDAVVTALSKEYATSELRSVLLAQIAALRRVYTDQVQQNKQPSSPIRKDAAQPQQQQRDLVVLLAQKLLAATPPRVPGSESFFALALDKATLAPWIQQSVWLAGVLAATLSQMTLKKEDVADASTLLSVMHALIDHTRWQVMDAADPRSKALALFSQSIQTQCFTNGLVGSMQPWLRRMVSNRKLGCTPAALSAAMLIVYRCCSAVAWKDEACAAWMELMAGCPALILQTETHASAIHDMLRRDANLAARCVAWTVRSKSTAEQLEGWDANNVLFALGNLTDLLLPLLPPVPTSPTAAPTPTPTPTPVLASGPAPAAQLLTVVHCYLQHCRKFVRDKKSKAAVSSEHPLLGWATCTTASGDLEAMPLVLKQLRKLWMPATVHAFLQPVWRETDRLLARPVDSGSSVSKGMGRFLRLLAGKPRAEDFVDAMAVVSVQPATVSYDNLISLFAPARAEITGSLAFLPELVPRLWTFMHHIGPVGGMQLFIDALGRLEKEPLVPLLSMTCSLTTHLLTVVHDDEIFERGDPFSLAQLLQITAFLNRFLARWLWEFGGGGGGEGSKSASKASAASRAAGAAAAAPASASALISNLQEDALLKSASKLLRLVLDIDSRRAFVPPEHWSVKELPSATLLAEYKREQRADAKPKPGDAAPTARAHRLLLTLPHLVDFHQRVSLLRQEAEDDRALVLAQLGEVRDRPYARIRRSAVLTDGFRELMPLPITVFKDSIRIIFINAQGLEEIGIDQLGLFKEFLELTLKEGVDPTVGLFKQSEDNRLYPNPASGTIQPDHLRLFEYLGRMFGKMVYEGYVVDLPFARFFLNRLLGRRNTLDDLPSLDAGMAKNLALVRDYPGDVADLGLTFAVDDEVLGQHITTPLRPGGADMEVTNENRLLYVHLVADYRLNVQMEAQVKAFAQGFRSLVPQRWLQLFHAREFARLTGGDDVPLDVADLRQHAQYADGYHSQHKVIKWLWEVVESDLTQKEQEAFLRFVTSCSKPPVLGFAHLRPAFTVRCMAEGATDDSYSLGGAVLNMFRGGEDTAKLPMASTCFNLLKLPPYKSKRLLRERLKYAISSGAGFELA